VLRERKGKPKMQVRLARVGFFTRYSLIDGLGFGKYQTLLI
jgi:hypothetical protein